MTSISSSSCFIDKLKSSAPCVDLSSVIKRWRWTFHILQRLSISQFDVCADYPFNCF
jgi:hypothetical protein